MGILKHIWLYLTSERYRLRCYLKHLNQRYKQMIKDKKIFNDEKTKTK